MVSEFEAHRHGRSLDCIAVGGNVIDPDGDNVIATQLVIDGQINSFGVPGADGALPSRLLLRILDGVTEATVRIGNCIALALVDRGDLPTGGFTCDS